MTKWSKAFWAAVIVMSCLSVGALISKVIGLVTYIILGLAIVMGLNVWLRNKTKK